METGSGGQGTDADSRDLGQPFIAPARAQTMLRDFDALRRAIRAHDSFAAEAAWDRCERWVDQLRPVTERCHELAGLASDGQRR